MFLKKLLVSFLGIVFFAAITVIVSAATTKQNHDNDIACFADVKKMVGDSTLHSVSKGECNSRHVKNGSYELNAFAPGGADDPAPLKGFFNGNWNDKTEAWGHNNTSGSYGATSKVSGTTKYGEKMNAFASI